MKFFNRDTLKQILFILLGCTINSLAINIFLVNANLLSGGVSGIALIVQYLTSIPAGYTTLILNIPLLILSYFKINKSFTFFTIIGTLGSVITLILTTNMQRFITLKDPLLLSIYGGVLQGIGIGLVFVYNGSTGGLDIITALIKKHKEDTNIGTVSFLLNGVIVVIGCFIFGISIGLYTLLLMYISSFTLDKTIQIFNRKRLVLIISDKEPEVTRRIMDKVQRGVTLLYGEGAYTKEKRNIIYTIVEVSQLPAVKQIVRTEDVNAFITVLDVSDVEGLGFKKNLQL